MIFHTTALPLWANAMLVAAALLSAALWVARSLLARATATAIAGIEARARQAGLPSGATPLPDDLPPPVRRYLDHVLPPDRRLPTLVRLRQSGHLRTDPRRERWMPFTASQVISPLTTEFLWTASTSVVPLLHVQVRDSLIDGTGAGRVALLSAIPVAGAAGGLEMNAGSLHRFLAEAVWCPTALLPSSRLTWQAIDDRRAIATLTDGPTKVSLEFRFNAQNEVTGIYTPARWGSFDGRYRQVAWEGRIGRYVRRQGVLVPDEGEVGWIMDGEWRPVWRGTVTSVSMTFR